MIQAHIYLDGKIHAKPRMLHCPRIGDELRLNPNGIFATVETVVWCLDEESPYSSPHDRVNIGARRIQEVGDNG